MINVSISPSFHSLHIEIIMGSSLSALGKYCDFIQVSMVLDKNYAVIWIGVPLEVMCHLSLATFKAFSLDLGFRSLIIMYLGVEFEGLFFMFSFSQLLQFVGLCLLQMWKMLSLYFLKYFQPHSSYPFLLGSNDINVGSFVIRSLGVCSFIFRSNQVNSFDLSFSSLITFTVTQLCSSSNKFLLIYVIIFSVL